MSGGLVLGRSETKSPESRIQDALRKYESLFDETTDVYSTVKHGPGAMHMWLAECSHPDLDKRTVAAFIGKKLHRLQRYARFRCLWLVSTGWTLHSPGWYTPTNGHLRLTLQETPHIENGRIAVRYFDAPGGWGKVDLTRPTAIGKGSHF